MSDNGMSTATHFTGTLVSRTAAPSSAPALQNPPICLVAQSGFVPLMSLTKLS
jgi:hypothetical protein